VGETKIELLGRCTDHDVK